MKPVDPRLLRHARHSRGGIALLAAIGLGQALAAVAVAIGLTLFLASTSHSSALGPMAAASPSRWPALGPLAAALSSRSSAVVLLAAAFATRAVLAWAEQVVAHRTAARVSDELRRSLVRAVARRGPAWVAGFGSGRLTALLTSGLESLRPWFAGYLPAVILGAALPPLVLLAIFRVDPASAVIALVTLPLIPLLGALIGWATQARAAQRRQADARLAGHFLDVVRGLATLRSFGRATRQTAVIEDLTDRHRSATLRVLRVAFLSSTALDLVGTLSVGLIAVSTGLRVAAGHLGLAPALLVILLAPEVYRPLREMAARYHAATDATAVIADVDEVLTDLPPALPTGDRAGLAASGLRVRHAGARRNALALPGLVVGAGEIVALTGPSGAGKTTALRALAGLQPVNAGTITLDGPPVYVPQSPSLPHARTVADLFPDGTAPAEIDAALRAVGLAVSPAGLQSPAESPSAGEAQSVGEAQSIPTLRWAGFSEAAGSDISSRLSTGGKTVRGLAAEETTHGPHRAAGANDPITAATPLGEHGAGVSAGQRHRLALAAALYRGPATLLLDEPTAHLDPGTEQLVIARLREAAATGSAILVAAHRPALIAAADRAVRISPPELATAGQTAGMSRHEVATAERTSPPEPAATSPTEPAPADQSTAADSADRTSSPEPAAGLSHGTGRTLALERWRHPWVAVALGSASSLSGLVLTGAAAWLLVRASSLPPVLTLSAAVVLVRGSAVARPLLRYLERLISHDLAFARLGKRRARIYEALIPRIPGARLHRRGDLLTKLVDDVDARVDGLLRGSLPAWAAWVTVAIGGATAAVVVPALALPLGTGLFIAGIAAPALAARQARRREAATGVARSRLRDAMVETVAGIEELRLSGLLRVPDRRSRELAAREAQAARSAGAAGALAHLGWGVAVTGAALVLGRAGLSHEWTGALLLGVVVLGESALGLPEAAVARVRAAAAEERLATLTAEPTAAPAGSPRVTEGPVAVRGLVAGWGERPALDGLDLDLPRGSRTAITGRSGAGKTTLGMVLAGFLEPRGGTVTFGGHRKVLLVGDDTGHIFASTVRENLRLAKPAAGDDELREVLRRVRLDDWLAGTPHGLGTWLGTGGSTVSGGQARRLATARALLADPDLLILDEPTEGLDEPTAEALMTDLLDAADGRTLLILTHRREGLDRTDVLTLT